MLTYNQNGTSRGIASIIFAKADTAAKAAKELNGLLVDGRPIKVSASSIIYRAVSNECNRSRLFSMHPTPPRLPPRSRSVSVLRKLSLICC